VPAVSGGAGDEHHDEYPVDQYGVPKWPDVTRVEVATLVPLLVLTVALGVWPDPFMDYMRVTFEAILGPYGSVGV
jgi:NADH:ubiquinone oxidoreductase subunit 4 (subunit M)